MALIIDESTGAYRTCNGNNIDGYESGCVFLPTSSGNATGSIMYGRQFYDKVRKKKKVVSSSMNFAMFPGYR